jgi:hypothetical protein
MKGGNDLKMELYCKRCKKTTEVKPHYPRGAKYCLCGCGLAIIVDGYELGSGNKTPQHIEDFMQSLKTW